MKLTIVIDCDNDAFTFGNDRFAGEVSRYSAWEEVQRIINHIGGHVGAIRTLRDINGNAVGTLTWSDE